jgi:hypothetical protein
LVRPCVSEDDLSEARSVYRIMIKQELKIPILSLVEYYLIIDESGGAFIGNIVNKSICKRIKKTTK